MTTVLLVGSTGMLGGHIAQHLLTSPDAQVRLLVRDRTDQKTTAAIAPFLAGGAEIAEGDLSEWWSGCPLARADPT